MSDESEDDYAEFGTPLEPLDEEDCPRKKPLTIEEQIATDQHGRRRFHGAFTGGFSAGFLNTVGSLEGWRPSSFKSSRSEKGSAIVQKPEHFMDEEDMGEFGIAPSLLRAKEDYHNTRKNKRKYPVSSSSILGMSVLKSLIQPAKETIGIKLLRKMGWKPGQGVGPRISKQEKKRIDKIRKKVYGCSLPNERSSADTDSDEDDDDDYEDLKNITFAPKDYPFQLVTPKENLFGIGYKGLEKRSILSVQRPQTEFQLINKQTITGQAFGVGAFEEEDEDIYSRDDMTQYDFMLGDAKEVGSASGCITGEDLYDAFVLALKKATKKLFPPPVLPGNFKPARKFSRFEPIPEPHDQKKTRLSPEKKGPAEEIEEIQKEARKVTENVSEIRQGTFKPFIADTDKQARYEKYLKLVMLGKQGDLNKLQPITMTEWEKERERIEFEQASKLFKPLTGIMEDRFTTGSLPDDINDPLAEVEKFKSGSEEQIKAAKMEMYGRLTRTVEDWKPASLLCKRFNVPELNMNEIPIVKTKPKYSIFDNIKFLEKEPKSKTPEVKVAKQQTVETEQTVKPTETKEIAKPAETKASETAMLSNLPENKIDLFNAIFLDSDSEDEAGDEGPSSKEQEKQLGKPNESVYEDTITNDERNMSPPRGIFENLDFNFLLSSKQPSEPKEVAAVPEKETPKVFENKTVEDKNEIMEADLTYGPKLPDKFPLKKIDFIPPPMVNSDCWVEKTEHRKHKKKDKKHKKSKHKSKHKHKSKK